MATEYKLNYTASDINAKLSVIDGTKTYYDSTKVDEKISESIVQSDYSQTDSAQPDYIKNKPQIDTEVVAGSENLITSGGVYDALQNINIDYTAGDLIEIKDGVIRSTLGDLLSDDTEEIYVEFYHADNIEMGDEGNGTYVYQAESILTNPIDINEKLIIEFNLSDGTNKTFNVDITSEYDGEGTLYFGFYNCVMGDDGLVKVDENSDALYFEGGVYGEEFSLGFATFEDYTGASIAIGQSKVVEHKVYATLPNEALSFDSEPAEGSENLVNSGVVFEALRNVSGKVESVNGRTGVVNLTAFDVGALPNTTYIPTVPTNISAFTNDSNYITSEQVDTKLESKQDKISTYVSTINGKSGTVNLTYSDVDALPNSTVIPSKVSELENDKGYLTEHQSLDNYVTDSTFTTELNKKQNTLTFDTEPTENSTNLVNSGDLYNVIGDINTVVAQINTLIGGAS